LHLRHAAEIDPGVGTRRELVLQPELEVAVVTERGRVASQAIVDQHALLDAPMRLAVLELGKAGGPLRDQRVALGRGQGQQLPVVVGRAATPAAQVTAVEQGGEAGRRGGGDSPGRQGEGEQQRAREGKAGGH